MYDRIISELNQISVKCLHLPHEALAIILGYTKKVLEIGIKQQTTELKHLSHKTPNKSKSQTYN